jgi:hypothetical protein
MIFITTRHTVTDYAKWRPIFDSNASNRRAAGATGVQTIYRDLANPNDITLLFEWDNAENAQKFFHNPAMVETMKTAGVIGVPEAHFMTRA